MPYFVILEIKDAKISLEEESYTMYFPTVCEANFSGRQREYHVNAGNHGSPQAGTAYDSIHHSGQGSSSLSAAQRYAQEHGQGEVHKRQLEEWYTRVPWAGRLFPIRRAALRAGTRTGGGTQAATGGVVHAVLWAGSGYHAQPTVKAQAPVNPERGRQVRSSDDVRVKASSAKGADQVSTQSYASAYNNGLRIPSNVLAELERHGETPISSYTFINGIRLGVSPTAKDHYLKLREVLMHFPGGPERIKLIESPSKPEDLTLLVTSSHPISPNVVVPFVNSLAHQSVMHFDPFHGEATYDGKRSSPMITAYHELEHVHQFLLVSRGDITQDYLSAKVDLFGEQHNRCEQLAVHEANRLAEHLRQGVIRNYGSAGEAARLFRAKAFDSNVPM